MRNLGIAALFPILLLLGCGGKKGGACDLRNGSSKTCIEYSSKTDTEVLQAKCKNLLKGDFTAGCPESGFNAKCKYEDQTVFYFGEVSKFACKSGELTRTQ